jgi:hypothetical protein
MISILLKIKSGEIEIALLRGKKILEKVSFLEEKNLSEKLLLVLEKLLKKNSVDPMSVKDFRVISDLEENYTTFRIAKSIAEAFIFAVKEKRKVKTVDKLREKK